MVYGMRVYVCMYVVVFMFVYARVYMCVYGMRVYVCIHVCMYVVVSTVYVDVCTCVYM